MAGGLFSPSYQRLESGMGPGGGPGSRRFGWKRLAIAAGAFIAIIYLFGPREKAEQVFGSNNPTYARPPPTKAEVEPLLPPIETTRPETSTKPAKTPPKVVAPTSPESDPDLLKTVHCTTKHKDAAALVQYALMIDAGSTGSRIHIYKFNGCGPSPAFEYEVFKQIKGGLSKYKNDPESGAKSLDALLDEAVKVVPPSLHKCTPVAVKATAGLRLTGAEQSKAILDAVRRRLETVYPFKVYDKDGVVIMDGSDEGVYAWITANYLLNTIRADSPKDKTPYAVLDLGGASTQIVFEPMFDKPDSSLVDGEHKYDLEFGGKKRELYQHSYLGYGLKEARAHVHQLVDFSASLRKSSAADDAVPNPCLARGTQRQVEVKDPRSNSTRTVTMKGEDIGSFDACNRVVELVMAKDAVCAVKPCSFNGVYQPSLMDAFPQGKILLLSYFYDRIAPLLGSGATEKPLPISSIAELATDVCLGPTAWKRKWGGDSELMKELDGRPEYCLDLTFMHALLRLGYEFDGKREVEIGKKIEGTELGWCLGATIAMVGGSLSCRI